MKRRKMYFLLLYFCTMYYYYQGNVNPSHLLRAFILHHALLVTVCTVRYGTVRYLVRYRMIGIHTYRHQKGVVQTTCSNSF